MAPFVSKAPGYMKIFLWIFLIFFGLVVLVFCGPQDQFTLDEQACQRDFAIHRDGQRRWDCVEAARYRERERQKQRNERSRYPPS
jgi:hypothetical protein